LKFGGISDILFYLILRKNDLVIKNIFSYFLFHVGRALSYCKGMSERVLWSGCWWVLCSSRSFDCHNTETTDADRWRQRVLLTVIQTIFIQNNLMFHIGLKMGFTKIWYTFNWEVILYFAFHLFIINIIWFYNFV